MCLGLDWWPADAENYGTDHIFAFGGDFNDYDPSDNSFCCNGVIAADRTYHPHAYEVFYQQRSILTSAAPEEVLSGVVNVYNENFFIDLSRYVMEWELQVDGVVVRKGYQTVKAAPQQTVQVRLDGVKDGLPADLKAIVKEEDIDFLAQSAMDDACRPGNPKDPTKEDIIALYKSLL